MPKVIMEFNLPDEAEELKDAQNGTNYSIQLDNFANFLRSKLKYSELTEEQYAIYEEIRSKLWEIRNEE